MREEESLEERKARVIIKLRGYRLAKKEKHNGAVSYLVRIPREKKKGLIRCVPDEGTVGVQFVKNMQKAMEEASVEKGIIITGGKHTHAARLNAKKMNIELLSRIFPAFNIFKHKLVPKHEILTQEDKEKILVQYKVKPYQLPQIKASDPAVTAIGAKPGDVLRIIRESPTAGEHFAYRYVVD